MGLLQTVRSWLNPSVNISMGVDPPSSINSIGGMETASGVSMSPQKAMQLSAVYACVKKISETIAMLPVHVVFKDGTFGRVDNVGNELLNSTPDGEITSNEFKETLVVMASLFGCGYAEILRDRNGAAYELKLRGSDTKLVEVDGVKMYKVAKDKYVFPRDMIVIPSILRKSPVEMNRETLGLFKAAQDYASKFFNGGGVMNGILSSDLPLNGEQIDTLSVTWEAQKGKQTRVLPNGMKYHRLGVEPDKAQNTASREFGAREICQIFGVPPAMIGLNGSSYGDYENQAKAFINNCIAPIAAKIEAEYNLKLLTRQERRTIEFRHDMDELSRGDMASRATYYREMLTQGAFSRNEVRAKERMSPVDGGDLITVQVNQIALSEFENYSKKISSNEQGAE